MVVKAAMEDVFSEYFWLTLQIIPPTM
jgi:hypothetical protein